MFGHNPFYFSTIRKYIIYFGGLFNSIYITRTDTQNNTTELMKVPLSYANKDKLLVRVDADPTITRPYAITLPRMGFEITGMRYNGTRKLNMNNQLVKKGTDPNRLARQYQSVPYDIDWNLYIMVKNAEDGTKIIEQILPFFTPAWTATLNILPEMNVSQDISLDFTNIQIEDKYDGDYTTRRAMIYTLSFTMQAYLYGPIVNKPIIKFSKMNFLLANKGMTAEESEGEVDSIGQITVTPGLLANGAPTSNGAASISPNLIEIDDDFGFVIDNTGIILNE